MSSYLNTAYTIKGEHYQGRQFFINCKVPSGQVLIEVQDDVGATTWSVLRTVTASEMFHLQCPAAPVDVRLTSSGGATFILPAV